MCQAIADGGRRCPRHRRDSTVAIHLAAQESGLSTDAVTGMFSELRRLARHTDIPHQSNEYEELIGSLREQATAEGVQERYREILSQHDRDEAPAPDTLYALTRLRARAIEGAVALNSALGDMASRAGATRTEVLREYEHALRSRAVQNDAANSPTAQDHEAAHERGLPTDTAHLIALNAIRNTYSANSDDRGPARFEGDLPTIRMGNHLAIEAKYDRDGGVVQVTRADNNATLYYRNVPARVWDELNELPDEQRFSYYTTRLMGNGNYQYDTPQEAEDDSYTYRCFACGQFRARVHECPERESLAKLIEDTPGSTRETFTREDIEAAMEADRLQSETESLQFQSSLTPNGGHAPELEEKLSFEIPSEEANELTEYGVYRLNIMTVAQAKEYLAGRAEYGGTYIPVGQSLTRAQIEELPEHLEIAIEASYLGEDDGNIHLYAVAPYNPDTHARLYHRGDVIYIQEDTAVRFDFRKRGKSDRDEDYDRAAGDGLPHRLVDKAAAHMNSYRDQYGESIAEMGGDLRTRDDVSFREGVETTMSWAPPARFKEAVEAGKVVQAPILWSEVGHQEPITIDEQGYEIENHAFVVQGELAMKLNDDGTYEAASPRSALRCNCREYEERYHCTHVSYVYRHAPKMGHQLAQKAEEPRTPLVESVSRRLTAVDYVEIDENEDETLREVRFKPDLLADPDIRHSIQARLPREAWMDEEDDVTLARMSNIAQSFIDTPPRHMVHRALSYTDNVTVPFRLDSRADPTLTENSFTTSYLSGSIQYYRDEDGELATSVKNLHCDCLLYQRSIERGDYYPSCPHTKIVSDHQRRMFAAISQGSVADGGGTDEMEVSSRLVESTNYRRDLPIYLRMNTEELTREEAIEEIEAERVRAQREEEARIRRENESDRKWRASKATEMNALYIEFNQENPEYGTYRAGQKELWQNVDAPYGEDKAAVHALIEETQSLGGSRRDVIGYRTQNVTDGVCDPSIPGSRRFGVELEFMLPDGVDRYEALEKIAAELNEEGLSDRDSLGGYHSGARTGWASWSLEEDSTVDGELVSPLMADTPEHWEQLDRALTILKKHGAKTSTKAGSHVHVSNGSFGGKLSKDIEVLRTVRENEDVLFRAASDPATGSHRGTQWCAPNVSTAGYGDVQAFEYDTDKYKNRSEIRDHMSHSQAVNFSGSFGMDSSAHIEYRMWDASLDAATIQQQVAASVAITEAAERGVDANRGVSKERDHISEDAEKGWGASGKRLGAGTSTVDDISARNVGAFVDRVFRRKEDRESFIRLYALSRNN